MKRLKLNWMLAGLCFAAFGAGGLRGQTLFDQTALLYNTNTQRGVNWQSQRGVPIAPGVGSDGRNSMLPSAPTARQFRGIVTYAGVTKKANLAGTVSGTSFAPNATALNWPRATAVGSVEVVAVLRANVGAPYLSRQVASLYGSTIPMPNVDLDGNLLGFPPQLYWYPEPFWTNVNTASLEHTGAPYYWSPHAGSVFATKTGPIDITWRRLDPLPNPLSSPPSGFVSNVTHIVIGGSYYEIKKISYVVSGLPVKRPKKIYWTEGIYRATGLMIQVPNGRVKEIKFLFNELFPEMVETNQIVQPYDLAITDQARRTIAVQNGFITAYNKEGRVFMEILGDTRAGPARNHLGFEIVDVQREAIPADVQIELGERVTAFPDNSPSDFDLYPSPVNQSASQSFAYRLNIAGANRVELYATRETRNISDYQVHWLEEGVEGLRWPFRFSRYKFVWPTDPAKYSHYVRPVVQNENAAKTTAVKLPTDNAPFLEYEDPSTMVRAKLTEDFSFYTFLDSAFPRHRTLIRYNVGEFVAFERVFSILETTLKSPGFDAEFLSGSVLDLDSTKGEYYGQLPRAAYFEGGSFTMEAWVNARPGQTGSSILEFVGLNDEDSVVFGIVPGDRVPYLRIDNQAVEQAVYSTNSTPEEGWVHLAVVFDATAGIGSIYINGVPAGNDTIHAPRNVTRVSNFIGRSMLNTNIMDAKFDNVRIWSVARTLAEINAGMRGVVAPGTPGLLAQYLFHEEGGTPSIALDSSGNNRNLTLVGAEINPHVQQPRYVTASAWVGERLNAPIGEVDDSLLYPYIAGYVHQPNGNAFSLSAYLDPFVVGFEEAARGSIIPVNARNDNANLEVWWFRPNLVNLSRGFKTTYWPSTIVKYAIRWPTAHPFSRDIILASNDGSGALDSLESKGSIYIQNNPNLPGYNPNEEHALMQGGQAYALRDDLNITAATGLTYNGVNRPYSSHPYVLVQYEAADKRPSMSVFRVLREQGAVTFNYQTPAGTILQPPMPLPLLEKPLGPKFIGEPPRSLNQEIASVPIASSSVINVSGHPTAVRIATTVAHPFSANERLALQTGSGAPVFLYTTNANRSGRTLDGYVSTSVTAMTPWTLTSLSPEPTNPNDAKFELADTTGILVGQRLIVRNPAAGTHWTVMVLNVSFVDDTAEPPVRHRFIEVAFPTAKTAEMTAATQLVTPLTLVVANTYQNWRVSFEELPPGFDDNAVRDLYQRVTLQDRKGNLWIYRGPKDENEQAFTAMKFYYKTLPGFYYPSRPFDSQPIVGTITPYLRSFSPNAAAGQDPYDGDPVVGSASVESRVVGASHALTIRYNAVWPDTAPILHMAETLTLPKRGLPAVRGQTSLQLLYQQSQHIADNLSRVSAVLHDPTREKEYRLNTATLPKIPDSIRKSSYRGKTYFPALPPHLAERLFVDPDRGPLGALVLKGQFMDEALGDDYVLLNVLGPQDRKAVKDLCLADDPLKGAWDGIVDNGLIQTSVQLFSENPGQPGTYIPTASSTVATADLSRISDDDQAVDSYALTGMGPGSGYVTLIAGNGLAFTPVDEPVSIHVVKVVPTLYRGEVKIVQSSNPLNEKLTLQQVVDLAGNTTPYEFEWLIAAPVDGAPPPVFENTRELIMGNGTWTHLRHPTAQSTALNAHNAASARLISDVSDGIVPVSELPFEEVTAGINQLVVVLRPGFPQTVVAGNQLRVVDSDGAIYPVTVFATAPTTFAGNPAMSITLQPVAGGTLPTPETVAQIAETILPNMPQSIIFRTFTVASTAEFAQLYLSLDLDVSLGAKVYLDGQLVAQAQMGSNDTSTVNAPNDFSPLPLAYRLGPQFLSGGTTVGPVTTHRMAIEIYSQANPGVNLRCNARLEGYETVDLTAAPGSQWLPLDSRRYEDGVRAVLGGTADVRSLADNYLVMRYRARETSHVSFRPDINNEKQGWSRWTEPQLAEGWIKRVLAGINPFNQRITDLFNNRVSTDVSLITQAGQRWEGDVALNLESMNNFGLIEIYETVLRRGRMLSIDAGINYGPANDALLLAAGYLNDLYMLVGNEAWADAANPTIGIGTKDQTYGDIATALFSFKGQVPSLLEEELALLRGRDDFLQPGVEVTPVYNRLVWNYTRGIDSGEVIYALNYNIQEDNDDGVNGVINADDARKMFPQGHGDAYGHYLTALKGYYHLLMDTDFDWVPRSEAVTVLGKPVQVDYQDERKFAAAASALARTGRQVFDLAWRQQYIPGEDAGWKHFSETRDNSRRTQPTTRFWGADHWASRAGQGAYLNWAVGNAILPAIDNDPSHEGIQKIDRTTVPELKEIVTTAQDLQTALDNAEAHLTPLGLPDGAIAFDINPSRVPEETHFEQVYERAKGALKNALVAFDDAKDVTRLLRSEQDSLADFQTTVAQQELAYENSLIELYGTPYTDDIGPGKTYKQGYAGPDLLHFSYVEIPEQTFGGLLSPQETKTYKVDLQSTPSDWQKTAYTTFNFTVDASSPTYALNSHFVEFTWGPHAYYGKPANWSGRRSSPGSMQQAISDLIKAHTEVRLAIEDVEGAKSAFDKDLQIFKANVTSKETIRKLQRDLTTAEQTLASTEFASKIVDLFLDHTKSAVEEGFEAAEDAIPTSFIAGLAAGGDLASAARSVVEASGFAIVETIDWLKIAKFIATDSLSFATETTKRWVETDQIAPEERTTELREAVMPLAEKLGEIQGKLPTLNQKLRAYEDSQRAVKALEAQGLRIQSEREVFRQRSAAIIQGFRTRDAAFRVFRAEKLERYKTLFDLASRYSYLAATAYDYETGLLNTTKGKEFVNRVVNSRALGVMSDGEPQFAGSNTGDPGLSSALAEMKADFDVLKGRLGFNNPATYNTLTSLRFEKERIINGADGRNAWKDVLSRSRMNNILDDEDVRRHCLQIERGAGLPVPGLVIEFGTTIADGFNLFGRQLAGGDHYFPPSAFATKIHGVGVVMEGYVGMENPTSLSGVVSGSGALSPSDPQTPFLDPNALAATPGIYLVPVGEDVMRTPPLGDLTATRHWAVNDIAIPMPFNIGGSGFNTAPLWQSSRSLSEPLFATRKHGEFRPVSVTDAVAAANIGDLSQFTSHRLIGRSVWNTKWKLVIPGHKLLSDPNEGLERFINSVSDIKLYWVTYSYSGN